MPPPKKVCKGSSREHFISPYILHCAFVFQIVDHTFIGLLIHTTSETAKYANALVLYLPLSHIIIHYSIYKSEKCAFSKKKKEDEC